MERLGKIEVDSAKCEVISARLGRIFAIVLLKYPDGELVLCQFPVFCDTDFADG